MVGCQHPNDRCADDHARVLYINRLDISSCAMKLSTRLQLHAKIINWPNDLERPAVS